MISLIKKNKCIKHIDEGIVDPQTTTSEIGWPSGQCRSFSDEPRTQLLLPGTEQRRTTTAITYIQQTLLEPHGTMSPLRQSRRTCNRHRWSLMNITCCPGILISSVCGWICRGIKAATAADVAGHPTATTEDGLPRTVALSSEIMVLMTY